MPWQKGISQEDIVRAAGVTYKDTMSATYFEANRVAAAMPAMQHHCDSKDGVQEALVFRLVESHAGTAELRLLATPEASLAGADQLLSPCLALGLPGTCGSAARPMPSGQDHCCGGSDAAGRYAKAVRGELQCISVPRNGQARSGRQLARSVTEKIDLLDPSVWTP